MQLPARILRNTLRARFPRHDFVTDRQRARHEQIIAHARTLFANHGRHALTLRAVALALAIPYTTFQRHFPDLDSLLAEILRRHLATLAAALAEIPQTDLQARRAAYFTRTRTAERHLTEDHAIFIYDLHKLPEDERLPLEEAARAIGQSIAGDEAPVIMTMLDNPHATPAHIEFNAALPESPDHAEPQPPPKPRLQIKLCQAALNRLVARFTPPITLPPLQNPSTA